MHGDVKVDERGSFTFPLKNAIQEGDDRRLSFAGSLRFTAHHGLLDIRIIDPEVIIGPRAGVLVARIDDTDTVEPIVSVGAAEPTRDGQDLVWHALPSALLGTAVALFGDVYPAGTEMAPLELRLTLDS